MIPAFSHSMTYSPNKLTPKPVADFQFTEESMFSTESFKRELIYNGKSGNTLRFLYRELSGSTLRYPFSQEVQYDLADGSVIGFKGARVQVESATNTKIKYKLITNFPD